MKDISVVDRDVNRRYWELHLAFGRKTGVPVILNTSFNVKGEPIVCTPDDAIRCLLRTEIDHLVIGDYLVDRPSNAAVTPTEPPRHSPATPSRARWIGVLRDGMLYVWFFLRSRVSRPDRTRRYDRIA